MAGKRILDAAKLLNAGSSVAKQHYVLRRQQWDVYTKTSSLAKAVKNQTDRVTVTAAAAVELAKKFNETGPVWQQQRGQSSGVEGAEEALPASRTEVERSGFEGVENAAAQEATEDARARQAAAAPTVESTRAQALEARQEQAGRPIATGGAILEGEQDSSLEVKNAGKAQQETDEQRARLDTQAATVGSTRSQALNAGRKQAASEDDGSVSSLRKRELQRQSERQIPAQTADNQSEQRAHAGEDTFSERTEHSSPELSSLPRVKIPREEEQTHEEPTLDGINTDIFSSPKVSSMLSKSGKEPQNPYAGRQKLPPKPLPEMVAAQERRQRELQSAASTSATPSTLQPGAEGDAETQDLAASIAQAAQPQPEPAIDAQPAQTPYEMRESRVPSSRFGRLWEYAGLGTSMAFGAVGESVRRLTGGAGDSAGSLMLSEGNLNRLVAKLSRMRGAALKLGQMISFQDSKVLPPTINAVLQRVQDSADYMPPSQRNQVLVQNLGQDWRELFSVFEEKPFAAASIGQVHKATLKSNSKAVAVKVQYPGVRNSIDSDLNNLSLLLTASRLLPKGLFLDKTIANARTELGWECDYDREAEACTRFRTLLQDETSTFTVPEVYTEASGPGVLTAEFMTGTAVTKIHDLTQADRDWVGTQILRLCLRELMEWRFMQTDPNWTNFLYNRQSKKLELLDFGASREFPDKFVEPYVALLIAASKHDREACRSYSIELGYLTGHESPAMTKAHVDSILTLAEPFVGSAPEVYDFEDQTITDRVRANIGLMLRERMAPPPEETYSLHRKLSGAFLLCARLKSKVKAKGMFEDAVRVWEGRARKIEDPS